MAFSVKIRGVPLQDGAPGWSLDNIFWWDMLLIRKRFPVREIVDPSMYLDYVVIMTPVEAQELNRLFADSYRDRHGSDSPAGQEAIDELSRRLDSARDTMRWIVVEQYEWESGR